MRDTGRTFFWVVVVVAAFLLFFRLGAAPLIDPDEARFARTSVEMVRSGDPVVPTFEGAPRIVKPPLLHWIQASLFRLLGVRESVARLPAALSTLGALFLVAWVARRRFGEEGAAWAAAVFITMPLVITEGRIGTLEALLSVHVLAVVAMDVAEPGEIRPKRASLVGALVGLAFLVKGPVGVVLPLLMMLAGRSMAGRDVFPGPRALLAFVAGWSVVTVPWAVAFVQRLGLGTALRVLREEALDRYFAGTVDVEPPWFYVAVVVAGFFPWVVPVLMGTIRLLGRRRDAAARTGLYCGAALIAGLLFFSLSRGKLAHYVLPLAPLAAILATWELGQELDAPRERSLGPLLLTASLMGFAMFLGTWAAVGLEEAALQTAVVGALAYGAASLVAVVGVVRSRPRLVYGAAAAASAALLAAAVSVLQPWIGNDRSARALAEAVPELGSDRPVVLVDIRVPSLVFYLDRVPEKLAAASLEARLRQPDDPLVVMADVDVDRVRSATPGFRLEEIAREGKLRVFVGSRAPGDAPPDEEVAKVPGAD